MVSTMIAYIIGRAGVRFAADSQFDRLVSKPWHQPECGLGFCRFV